MYQLLAPGDHPREYGENRPRMLTSGINPGSSPRIRGESLPATPPAPLNGIIPANTGRIVSTCLRSKIWWDHPREYGEN